MPVTTTYYTLPESEIPPAWGLGKPVTWDPSQNASATAFSNAFNNPSPETINALSQLTATAASGIVSGQAPTGQAAPGATLAAPGSVQDYVYRAIFVVLGLAFAGIGLSMFRNPVMEVIKGQR